MLALRLALLGLLLLRLSSAFASETHGPVAMADKRLTVTAPQGEGRLAVSVSQDWSTALPLATHAVVVVHGFRRDADTYRRIVQRAAATVGIFTDTLLIAPQFVAESDVSHHHAASDVLRWRATGWSSGEPALGPAPLSSFDALDAILARLADRAKLPALRSVVIAGHSAGAQLVQRYAVVGRRGDDLVERGIAVRYVVANPSSYLWFGDARPVQPVDPTCAVTRWKYGLVDPPAYVQLGPDLEDRYIRRDVVYLLGEADTDPEHELLDQSCAAEAQGADRYERGMNYLFALELRHPNLVRHRIASVWGVGHDAAAMFTSPCGLAALFLRPGCPGM